MSDKSRWSYSRMGAFESCIAKYKFFYIDKLQVIGREAEETKKGLASHHIAEIMDSKFTREQLIEEAKKILGEADFDQEKYPVIQSINRFWYFWNNHIKPREEKGWAISKENWINGDLKGEPFIGALDLLMISPDNDVVIIDYKTPKNANASNYKNQLLCYAWFISKNIHIPFDKITEKIKLYVFFPLADLKPEELTDLALAEKQSQKNIKEIIYSKEDVAEVIKHFEKIVDKSNAIDWSTIDLAKNATMAFGCKWCGLLGHKDYCPHSHSQGFIFPRRAKIVPK